ncbi:MAG: bifunctional (p)ppGpp synthetase/guanosine-3',5'-bis(diphosphate) 3'-pyrophosphohydrolase [Nanoarchaeales archaeon]|nr:bifunctional (p)ppGpp synthetase/guanosine-3',5'-bis(diphosphate) 3'-pyrophosphohydrolase [Nanoarchaeales archaeon]
MTEENKIKTIKDIDLDFEKFYGIIKPEFDKKTIRITYEYAKKAHRLQNRATGEPYISHPLAVATMVHSLGLDTISILAALLHDVVEDTEITSGEIKEKFGEEVGLIVDGLTKIDGFAKNKSDQKIEALRKVLLASAKDIRILVIKLCDRLHNMRTLGVMRPDKKERIAKETMLIYAPIAQKIGLYSIKWELEDLSFKYINPDMYQFVKEKVHMTRSDREEVLNKAVDEIKKVLDINKFSYKTVLGRPKNFYSIYKKIKDNAKTFEDIYDLYAIRITVGSISDCYTLLGHIHEKFQAFPDRLKDYIANPKLNGYQSIHTTIFSKAINCPVEIQIRTEDMHKLAEFGVAAHWRYKSLKEDKKFEKKIAWLREVMLWEKEHKDNDEFMKLLRFDFFEDEMFLFTPKNDVIVLPENATVLDFAYSVHTEIGERALKGKVNGAMCTLDKSLKSGDIVEIITNQNGKPSEKWLKFVVTNKARIKIRNTLHLKKSGPANITVDDELFSTLKLKIKSLSDFKKSRKAGCCEFKYNEEIVGVIGGKGKDKEIVVHSVECDNAKFTINEKIGLKWKEMKTKEIVFELVLTDKIGLLMDILNLFASRNVSINSINSKVLRNGDTSMTLTLEEGNHVEVIEKKLREFSFVRSLKIKKKLFNF